MPFDQKAYLDRVVVPLLTDDPDLSLYSVFWHGAPPTEVLVFVLAKPDAWVNAAHRLLGHGFRFDFLRDVQVIEVDGQRAVIFGGDGTPLYDKSGTVSIRLWKQIDVGAPHLILQLGARCDGATGFGAGVEAAALVKGFFALYDESPLEVCQKFATPFGAA